MIVAFYQRTAQNLRAKFWRLEMWKLCYLPVDVDFSVEHESDVVWKPVNPVDPHEGDRLEDGQPEDPEPTSVGVHDVEDIRPRIGDTGKTGNKMNRCCLMWSLHARL